MRSHCTNIEFMSDTLYNYVYISVYDSYQKCEYGDRAFSAAAPAVWNGLPAHIRCAKTLDNFIKLLKMYFIRQAFDEA